MSKTDWTDLAKQAESIVREAASLIRTSLNKELIIEFKSNPNDLVTEMDRKVEAFFNDEVKKRFKHHRILGEEGTGKDLLDLSGVVWIIDPIDGTINFVHQQRHFAISVGIYDDGVGMIGIIYDVVSDELYLAINGHGAYLNNEKLPVLDKSTVSEALIAMNAGWIAKDNRFLKLVNDCRGTRSYGSAALEIASVVANRIDAYISFCLSPWDYAAGVVLVKEVGGIITSLDGKELNLLTPGTVCVAKKGLYEQLQNDYVS